MSATVAAQAGVSALQLTAACTGGPLLCGLMAKVRARAEGRAGAPVRQPLLDLNKLIGKERIHAEHSSVVLPLAPLVFTASAAAAVIIAPLISTRPAFGRRPARHGAASSAGWLRPPTARSWSPDPGSRSGSRGIIR